MIEFTYETTRFKVKPENAQAIRNLAAKPPKIKNKGDRKHDSMRRDYPEFYLGMTTEDYLNRYASLNNRLTLSPWAYNYDLRLAPTLDATQPEVVEEVDAGYIEPVKAKKLTAKQAMTQALKALEKGDIDTAQCILAEGLK
jgi:hypothetical protein